jgi:hypothetical protein
MNDALLDLVARLPAASVLPERSRRTLGRCHRALARRAPAATASRPAHWRAWSRALVGLGALYIIEGVRHLLRAYGAR